MVRNIGFVGLVAVIAGGVALASVQRSVSAQDWPQKPIRIVNPFAAGGGTDTFARPIAQKLTQQLGRQVIIENIGGAGGTIGAANAARSSGDGYNWFMGSVHHTIAETLYTQLPYSLARDFLPVTLVASVPNVVVVHPKHGFRTIAELVSYAKSNPDKLSFGSAGNGTTHHLAGELFKMMTGTRLLHIPYKGAGPMMQDLLAGQVDLAFDGMGTSASQIKGGKLRPLGVTTERRSAVIPDVPTLQEAGLKGYDVTTWYALWAIKGTPREIVERMQIEVAKALQMQDIRDLWASQGASPGGQPPAQFAEYMRSEIAKWAKIVKESGARIDG